MLGLSGYEISLITSMGIAVIFALSLNLITGFCGQISLGHAAFYGIGAYTSAMLTKAGMPFGVGLLGAVIVAGLIGIFIGIASLRVRHDFLAITTMGVGFLFIGIMRQWDLVGGEMGVSSIPGSGLGKSGFMFLVLGFGVLTVLFSLHLKRSWMGYAFDAIADDEDTARVVGLNVSHYKLAAFAMGTALAGLAGALYAHNVRFIDPESFGFVESITVLSMVVIGGIGSVFGVVFAAAVLSVLPLWIQFIDEYKLLLYGGLLFAMMRFSPGGLAGLVKQILRHISSRKSLQKLSGGTKI
ncbi:branched-chain amino acid ABC transporter permease [Kiloniella spongiae]|uniref:Branched-chain amino acid ABC transporter permease n=1 Tax=Kiloniella spongiae TaxID=1489064 RepID=A0A0H2MFM0_9PROT|nr:branched-chain amino acid ABC transporter permease [Kiloniella spongiae]KLN59562.1 branched-chain amino acid ABC transporter permease [Kiloniella spongiae]